MAEIVWRDPNTNQLWVDRRETESGLRKQMVADLTALTDVWHERCKAASLSDIAFMENVFGVLTAMSAEVSIYLKFDKPKFVQLCDASYTGIKSKMKPARLQ